jgi:hypothetical protein
MKAVEFLDCLIMKSIKKMKNKITLHQAVIEVLSEQPGKTATLQQIADEIEYRNLFPIRKGRISLAEQIRLRTTIKSSPYKHLFEFTEPDILKLL